MVIDNGQLHALVPQVVGELGDGDLAGPGRIEGSDGVWAEPSERIRAFSAYLGPLRRVISPVADGPFGSAFSSDDYVEDGPAVIRLGNIGFGEFRQATFTGRTRCSGPTGEGTKSASRW